ncbi:Intersectin-2 [Balamuthia mandrillaris]
MFHPSVSPPTTSATTVRQRVNGWKQQQQTNVAAAAPLATSSAPQLATAPPARPMRTQQQPPFTVGPTSGRKLQPFGNPPQQQQRPPIPASVVANRAVTATISPPSLPRVFTQTKPRTRASVMADPVAVGNQLQQLHQLRAELPSSTSASSDPILAALAQTKQMTNKYQDFFKLLQRYQGALSVVKELEDSIGKALIDIGKSTEDDIGGGISSCGELYSSMAAEFQWKELEGLPAQMNLEHRVKRVITFEKDYKSNYKNLQGQLKKLDGKSRRVGKKATKTTDELKQYIQQMKDKTLETDKFKVEQLQEAILLGREQNGAFLALWAEWMNARSSYFESCAKQTRPAEAGWKSLAQSASTLPTLSTSATGAPTPSVQAKAPQLSSPAPTALPPLNVPLPLPPQPSSSPLPSSCASSSSTTSSSPVPPTSPRRYGGAPALFSQSKSHPTLTPFITSPTKAFSSTPTLSNEQKQQASPPIPHPRPPRPTSPASVSNFLSQSTPLVGADIRGGGGEETSNLSQITGKEAGKHTLGRSRTCGPADGGRMRKKSFSMHQPSPTRDAAWRAPAPFTALPLSPVTSSLQRSAAPPSQHHHPQKAEENPNEERSNGSDAEEGAEGEEEVVEVGYGVVVEGSLEQEVLALYDWKANDDDELDFTAGTTMTLVREHNEEWWLCRLNGRTALVPASYVQKM